VGGWSKSSGNYNVSRLPTVIDVCTAGTGVVYNSRTYIRHTPPPHLPPPNFHISSSHPTIVVGRMSRGVGRGGRGRQTQLLMLDLGLSSGRSLMIATTVGMSVSGYCPARLQQAAGGPQEAAGGPQEAVGSTQLPADRKGASTFVLKGEFGRCIWVTEMRSDQ